MKSSYNSYYRYQLQALDDLLPETFERRKKKALHNNKDHFFFDISGFELTNEQLQMFLKMYLKPEDLVFLAPQKSALAAALSAHQAVYYYVQSESDFTQVTALKPGEKLNLIFNPVTSKNMKALVKIFIAAKDHNIYWRFLPYNPALPKSLTLSEINSYDMKFPVLPGLEIYNSHAPAHYELQPQPSSPYSIRWKLTVPNSNPKISVIIPTYNNGLFLSNVIWHLAQQDFPKEQYEVIIADDGSTDNSCEIIEELFSKMTDKFNITYIHWPKFHPKRGEQKFFRSGLARNLGSRYSSGEYLLFLDSDMLVPKNFITTALSSLQNYGVIQFQRFHIHQEISKSNPSYETVKVSSDTYIEEKHYWSSLFYCNDWQQLPQYWKYTCTYALGLKKKDFLDIGMFKKYYISYGFEDTDLGYEAHKRNLKFQLVKLPLLHLTAYDQMQYKNSFSKRVKLLKVTAELFYLQHIDKEIFNLLGDYLKMQKPFKSAIRDLFS
ncbi:MAG: hypothetical protein K0R29_286 [Pseudobdellovibrio sp.]|nr:hypothetical protein [Pseudobdellovibrio sp.]